MFYDWYGRHEYFRICVEGDRMRPAPGTGHIMYIKVAASQWKKLCTSCDVGSSPDEKKLGRMTLAKCQQECEKDDNCTAIDYGKGSRAFYCYLNYGGKTSYHSRADFDAYIFQGH